MIAFQKAINIKWSSYIWKAYIVWWKSNKTSINFLEIVSKCIQTYLLGNIGTITHEVNRNSCEIRKTAAAAHIYSHIPILRAKTIPIPCAKWKNHKWKYIQIQIASFDSMNFFFIMFLTIFIFFRFFSAVSHFSINFYDFF